MKKSKEEEAKSGSMAAARTSSTSTGHETETAGAGGQGKGRKRGSTRARGSGAASPPSGSDAALKGGGAEQAMETMQYDRLAITYLSLLLLPLVVGFSLKKLVMDEHPGWYSWALQSLTVSGQRARCELICLALHRPPRVVLETFRDHSRDACVFCDALNDGSNSERWLGDA